MDASAVRNVISQTNTTLKINIQTAVSASPAQVWEGFTESLFLKLSPPFPPVRLLRYDGNTPPDEVHIELNFLVFRQVWVSVITDQQQSPAEYFFVDEGKKLPFFLSRWRHKHRIVAQPKGSLIIDEIEFSTPTLLTNFIFYPILYAQFLYRKPIYRNIFS